MIVVKVLPVVAFAARGVWLAVSNRGSVCLGYLAGGMGMPAAWRVIGRMAFGALPGAAVSGAPVLRWPHRAEQGAGHLRGLPCLGA